MELASRIVSILLGVAVMVFVLWPVTVPVGFGEVWWASRQGQKRPAPAAPESQRETDLAPAASQHAVTPAGTPMVTPDADEVAIHTPENTGAVMPPAPAPPAAPEATKLYHHVTVRDGGTLQSGKIVIRLTGIVARDAEATCKRANGKTWRCGAAARAALSRLIRGRAVECKLPKDGEHNIFDTRCSVGRADLSTWMVQQGWAEAKDPVLDAAAKQAKADGLGLWRSDQ
jgi:endonuclease YncB( thermonuclease family)